MMNSPLPSVVSLPICSPASLVMMMVLLGSAVPLIRVPSGLRLMTGISGGVRSTIKSMVCDIPLWLPAASVSCTQNECEPSVSG